MNILFRTIRLGYRFTQIPVVNDVLAGIAMVALIVIVALWMITLLEVIG